MKRTTVISTAPFVKKSDGYYAYGPYIAEMKLWARHSEEIAFLCPLRNDPGDLLLLKVDFPVARIYKAREFDLKSPGGLLRAIGYSFFNFYLLFRAMKDASHIHLRCPGNISLMGCMVQIFFPGKPKSAKYAGNWDPRAKQPLSYRIQKWILSSTILTKNMSVMAYGSWPGSSKNVKPFFTATYRETDKSEIIKRDFNGTIRFIFVGTLSPGKRPLYAIDVVDRLRRSGYKVSLDFYGDGSEREVLERYIKENDLSEFVRLKGNQPQETVRTAYESAHFLILASKSEGWPKAVAEAMFWGCIPMATQVSCVPFMVGDGSRGILLDLDLESDVAKAGHLIENEKMYHLMSADAAEWSRKYTVEIFENEIERILQT